MTKWLDPRFAKIVAKAQSTPFPAEKDAAWGRARVIAEAGGLTLDQALHQLDPAGPKDPPTFDEWLYKSSPDVAAEWARTKSASTAARNRLRAETLLRYGSEQAALAPCYRENLLRTALRKFIIPCDPPHERWTRELIGWEPGTDPPQNISQLAKRAYPMPTTLGDAMAEDRYWHQRYAEFQAFGDNYDLDLVADVRAYIVSKACRCDLPLFCARDIYERALYNMRYNQGSDADTTTALLRDLKTLAEKEAESQANTPGTQYRSTTDRLGAIQAMLQKEPNQTDRDIARAVGCSPTTVGKVPRNMGLNNAERTVHRNGQMYRMKIPF